MSSLPLMRTEYWNVGTDTVRTGATAHGESLTDIEDYLLPLSQMEASSRYTAGVVEGLAVSAVPGQAGVTISPGVALDAAGNIIALAAAGFAVVDPAADPSQIQGISTVPVGDSGLTFSTDGASGDCFLTISWREVLGQSQLGNAPVLIHAPWLRLPAAAGFQDAGEQVILALVTLDGNGLVTALAAGASQPDGSVAPGRQSPATHAAGITLQSAGAASTAAGLLVSDSAAGQLRASDASTVRLEVSDPAGVLELVGGQGPASGVTVLAGRLSLHTAADAQGSQAIDLDATSSTVTAGGLRLGGAQSGVSLGAGPAAGVLAATADRVTVRASDGTDKIILDGTTATVSTGSVLVGGAQSGVSLDAGPAAGVLALSAPTGPAQLGVGTPAPRNPVGIRGTGTSEELLSFEDAAGGTRWHINQKFNGQPGLNLAETGVADGRLFLQPKGALPQGRVGINTTTPAFELQVNGTVCANQFCNPSDLRLKREVTPLADVLGRLAGIRAVSYRPADAGSGHRPTQIGVLAQDVQAAFPELVLETQPDGLKAVDYAGLAGVLVGAVQELLASNTELATRLAGLEQRMTSTSPERNAGQGSSP